MLLQTQTICKWNRPKVLWIDSGIPFSLERAEQVYCHVKNGDIYPAKNYRASVIRLGEHHSFMIPGECWGSTLVKKCIVSTSIQDCECFLWEPAFKPDIVEGLLFVHCAAHH